MGTDLDPNGVPRPSQPGWELQCSCGMTLTYLAWGSREVLWDPQAPRGNCRGRGFAVQRAARKPRHKPPLHKASRGVLL